MSLVTMYKPQCGIRSRILRIYLSCSLVFTHSVLLTTFIAGTVPSTNIVPTGKRLLFFPLLFFLLFCSVHFLKSFLNFRFFIQLLPLLIILLDTLLVHLLQIFFRDTWPDSIFIHGFTNFYH